MELNATYLLQLSMFLLLLAFFSKFLFPPMLRLFEERERRIDGASQEAQRLAARADEAAGAIEEKMAAATSEARSILGDLRAEGQKREQELIDQAREQARGTLEDARAELFATTEKVRSSLKADADQIASDIVEKIIGRAA